MRRIALLALTMLLALVTAVPAAAAPKEKSPRNGGGTCQTQTYSYDSGGSPGAGAANDPLFAEQWGLDQINAPEAWARGARGGGALIAVVDTGVDLAHPDLKANLAGAGADFVETRNDCPAGAQDEQGHGTHVAGIAAAVTNNGFGVAGTAPDAKILPVRVLDEDGSGSIEQVVAGIRWAADQNADVINLSLGELPVIGQSELLNEDVEAAVDYAYGKGSVIVAAAGNDAFPLCSYPSAARKAICVGATDRRGAPTFYSNFPNDAEAIGVRAPGGAGSVFCEHDEDIWSTVWPGSGYDCQGSSSFKGLETLAGTSMATPYVAGVAALLSAQGLSNQQIYDRIEKTSSNKGTYDPVYGYGIVDADAATR